jgi:regulator of sirC expression with transglutaminase-like and TPR domain
LPDNRIDLGEAALRIATLEYPNLDVARWLREIDAIASRAVARAGDADRRGRARAVDHVLFEELGFHGNVESYYDPRNSFLNDVIARRTGIPITLSVLYIEVARRAGLEARGIGFPGHFLVGREYEDGVVEIVDPFNGGARLERDDCARMLAATGVDRARLDTHLEFVSNRQILSRMLTNLKLIYLQAGSFDRALETIDRLLQVGPASPREVRDRGLVRLQVGDAAGALRDLTAYADATLDGEEADVVRSAIAAAKRELAKLN